MDESIKEEIYHGTTSENAEKIINMNKFYPGEEKVDEQFLGKGIYFFRNSQHAVMWNIKRAKDVKLRNLPYKRYIQKYSILKSKIEYNRKNLLDLNDANDIAKYDKICKRIKRQFLYDQEYQTALHKDRAIINYLYKKNLMEGIYIIRKISGQRPKVDELNVTDWIQRDILCVKDDKIITDVGQRIIIEEKEYNNIKVVSF